MAQHGKVAGVFIGGIAIAAAIGSVIVSGGATVPVIIGALKIAGVGVAAAVGTGMAVSYVAKQSIPTDLYLPLYQISPEEIFSGEILLFDVNFFNPKPETTKFLDENHELIKQKSSAVALQGIVSKWYLTIRNFSIVALLSILVYIGIRIIISSTAQDKAKYKQRLLDWLIAMCMLFFLHYIMSFAVTVTELITDSLAKEGPSYIAVFSEDDLKDYHWDFKQFEYKYSYDGQKITKEQADEYEKNGDTDKLEIEKNYVDIDSKVFEDKNDGIYKGLKANNMIVEETDSSGNVKQYLFWPTNLMGKARIDAQLEVDGPDGDNTVVSQFANTMIFVALVIYTIMFVFRYLQRVLMLAFLTIIAPFVAMTYPLDKMGDGSAQAFNMWLKEYLYNLLIQPVHLILYTMLIGTAFEFSVSNPLYTLVALGFMLQAEKIMRKFFGFEKASTVAGGSALGGAMAMQAINSLRKIGGPKRGKGGAGGKGDNGAVEGNEKIKMADRKADDGKDIGDLLDDGNSDEEGPKTAAQRMVDADDEGFGTDSFDPQERDALARDAHEGEGMNYTASEYADILRDSGYSEKEINDMISSDPRYASNEDAGSNESSQSETASNRKTHKIKGVMSVAGKGLATTGRIAMKAAPKIGGLALKGTVAGTAALAGMAAGLVSDDYSNVLKWGAAGAGAGWAGTSGAMSVGKGIGNTASGVLDTVGNGLENGIESAASTYTITAHGYEAEEQRQNRKADKAAMKDKDRQAKYAEKLKLQNKAAIQEAMKQAQTYRESGITDDDLIIKAMKAKSFNSERDSRERIITAGLAEKAKNNGQDVKKNLDYIKGQLSEKGINEKDIDKYITGIKEINKWKI